ncbi:MAG: hypothetical protein CMD81_06240 [Gammaproteobacteria bacterium]|nr:hypothetical protein [Gammaproteobacteria bacterium]
MQTPCNTQDYQKASGSTLWFDLRPSGHYQIESPSVFQTDRPSINTWSELVDLICKLCSTSEVQPQSTPGFYISQWSLDTLHPDEQHLQTLSMLIQQQKLQGIDLLLDNNLEIVPEIIHIHAHELSQDPNSQDFWLQPEAQAFTSTFLENNPEYALLLECIQHPNTQLDTALFNTVDEAFEKADFFLDYTSETQSGLWWHIKSMLNAFVAEALSNDWQSSTSTQLLLDNPIYQSCKKIESSTQGGAYSIGAGQMIATLDLTRQLLDQGLLPLSTPLIADNRAGEGILELQQMGKRKLILGDLWVNPEDRKPIAVQNATLRHDLIQKYNPAIIFLNVKAQALPQIFNDSFCEFLAQLDYTPILVMPSKSYTLAGHTPYQALFERLALFKQDLADQLTVLGGFYAAPSILTGDLIHMTAASPSEKAALSVSQMLSTEPCSPNGQTTKVDSTSLELQIGSNTAAMLMAGGANKNYLTYTAARKLLQYAFSLDHTQPQEWLSAIDKSIQEQRQHNVDYSQILTAQLLGLDVHKLPEASPGLVTDFVHCLPLTGRGICALVEQSYRIQKHILRTPPAQRAEVAQQQVNQLIQYVRQDSQRLLGTRNARDGFIDELIAHFHSVWLKYKRRLPLAPVELALFYKTFYPDEWLGESAQEGRNGILPVIVKASLLDQHGEWYQQLIQIWAQYYPLETELPLPKPGTPYLEWHAALLRLLAWIAEQDTGLLEIGRSKLKEWIIATERHQLESQPALLNRLKKIVESESLPQECLKQIRDL